MGFQSNFPLFCLLLSVLHSSLKGAAQNVLFDEGGD